MVTSMKSSPRSDECVFRTHHFWLPLLVGLSVLALIAGSLAAATALEGSELIGTRASSWDGLQWINSQPLSLDALRGQVVLVRWWTGPECQYCAASAPHLNEWDEKYHAKGLVVVGFYHHKSSTPLTRTHVSRLIERYRFRFPVAIDPDWRNLKRWWLEGHEHRWTSVSFLLDKKGVIRYIHPGGSYTEADAQTIESLIQALLKRIPTTTGTSQTGGEHGSHTDGIKDQG